MEIVKNKEFVSTDDLDKYWNRIKIIMHELSKSEGWLELVKDINANKNALLSELVRASAESNDIRYVNNIGIKIEMYNYVLGLPSTYIEYADRYFKSKEKKENK